MPLKGYNLKSSKSKPAIKKAPKKKNGMTKAAIKKAPKKKG